MSTHIHILPKAKIYKGRNQEIGSVLLPIEEARKLDLESLIDNKETVRKYKIRFTTSKGEYYFAEYETKELLEEDKKNFLDNINA